MKTKIYPQHIVSAYILFKIGCGEKIINSEEAASVIPKLQETGEFELMRMSYRSTAIGKYSPEFRSYFGFLDSARLSMGREQNSVMILRKGIEDAVTVIADFRKEKGESAANRLQESFGQVLRAA